MDLRHLRCLLNSRQKHLPSRRLRRFLKSVFPGPCLQLAMLFLTSPLRSALVVVLSPSRVCFSSCVHFPASLLASASVSLRERRTHTTCAMRGLGFVKVLAVSTSCSLVHVLTYVSACSLTRCSARTFACCAWFAGLTGTTLLPSRLCASRSVFPELGCSGSSSQSFSSPLSLRARV